MYSYKEKRVPRVISEKKVKIVHHTCPIKYFETTLFTGFERDLIVKKCIGEKPFSRLKIARKIEP